MNYDRKLRILSEELFSLWRGEGIKTIPKSNNHSHFWILDDVLYESYQTIRGLRYNAILELEKGAFKDCEVVSDPVERMIFIWYYQYK